MFSCTSRSLPPVTNSTGTRYPRSGSLLPPPHLGVRPKASFTRPAKTHLQHITHTVLYSVGRSLRLATIPPSIGYQSSRSDGVTSGTPLGEGVTGPEGSRGTVERDETEVRKRPLRRERRPRVRGEFGRRGSWSPESVSTENYPSHPPSLRPRPRTRWASCHDEVPSRGPAGEYLPTLPLLAKTLGTKDLKECLPFDSVPSPTRRRVRGSCPLETPLHRRRSTTDTLPDRVRTVQDRVSSATPGPRPTDTPV